MDEIFEKKNVQTTLRGLRARHRLLHEVRASLNTETITLVISKKTENSKRLETTPNLLLAPCRRLPDAGSARRSRQRLKISFSASSEPQNQEIQYKSKKTMKKKETQTCEALRPRPAATLPITAAAADAVEDAGATCVRADTVGQGYGSQDNGNR